MIRDESFSLQVKRLNPAYASDVPGPFGMNGAAHLNARSALLPG